VPGLGLGLVLAGKLDGTNVAHRPKEIILGTVKKRQKPVSHNFKMPIQ